MSKKKPKKTVAKKSRFPFYQLLVLTPSFGLLVASLVGFFGAQWWFFELFSHFRLQYLLSAAMLFAVFCGFRVWKNIFGKAALLATMFAYVLNAYLIGALYLPVKHSSNSTSVTILFSNIYIYSNQSAPLLKFIDETDPDVIALAEVNDRMFSYYAKQLEDEYPYKYHRREKRLFGVAIFSKTQPTNEDIVHFFSEDALPSLKYDLEYDSKPLSVIVTHPYPPMNKWYSRQRNGQLLGAADYIGKTNTPTVLVGDFNMTPWSPYFKEVLKRGKLHNSMSGMGLQASWPTWAPSFTRIPIDHALVTEDIDVVNRYRGPIIGSDHLPIVVKLALPD